MKSEKTSAKSEFELLRQRMVVEQIERRGIRDKQVLNAMRAVPRHLFVSHRYQDAAHDDGPLPIGHDQTISQPFIVASMTEELNIDRNSRVLEIGTGCGYQTAVLCEITKEVFSIERIEELSHAAKEKLNSLGYKNVNLRVGDGTLGWPEYAPFDAIIVTAAARSFPEALIAQLAIGGRLVIPIGGSVLSQQLNKVTRTVDGIEREILYPVRFVPLV